MRYDFDDAQKSFDEYIERCKDKLVSTFFTRDDAFPRSKIAGLSDEEVNAFLTDNRMKMINSKVEHTMRMVQQIIEINKCLDLRFDFDLVLKNAILFHDLGRFGQAMRGDTFTDSDFYGANSKVKNGFSNHGDEGSSIYLNEKFAVDDAYKWTISESIKYHGVPNDSTTPNTKFLDADKIHSFGLDDLLTGPIDVDTIKEMNSSEYLAYSLVTQLVADIDKVDILYQCKTATFDDDMLVRKYVTDRSRGSLDEVARDWGITREDILDYYEKEKISFDEKQYDLDRMIPDKNVGVRIPVEKIDISKLIIPDDFMQMLKTNNWSGNGDRGGLKLLQKRSDWNFLTIFLWRLGKFICDINFTSVLKNVDDLNLLDDLKKRFIEMGNQLTGVDGKPMGDALFSLIEEGYNFVYDVVQERVYANRSNIVVANKRVR